MHQWLLISGTLRSIHKSNALPCNQRTHTTDRNKVDGGVSNASGFTQFPTEISNNGRSQCFYVSIL